MLVPKIIWPKKIWASKRFWVWKKFQVWKFFGTKGTRGCACAHAFSLFFIIAGELSVCWSLSYYGVFLISLLFSHNKKLLAISVILPKLLGTNRLSNKEKLYRSVLQCPKHLCSLFRQLAVCIYCPPSAPELTLSLMGRIGMIIVLALAWPFQLLLPLVFWCNKEDFLMFRSKGTMGRKA